MSGDGRVALTINGQRVEAEKGRLLIDVAEEMGIFVPRFCYHPGMRSVAVCRMCLVQVEGQRKLLPACATPVGDGMNVNTVEGNAIDAQRGMLEFLLINHPLDCPICDRGGECPLQDQTYRHGPGSSRYVEPKRTYEKALEISDLVVLDRERCVLCWRCVRFADEVAGDQFIQLVDRGAGTQILTFKDEPFDSYFSGNTIQICPVGALTAKTYRFVSRPWDLKTAPSVCAYCSVGCPVTNEARSEKLVRCQALPNENVNEFWICDKGRFGLHYVDSEDRLDTPLVRSEGGEFEPTSWGAALDTVATRLREARGNVSDPLEDRANRTSDPLEDRAGRTSDPLEDRAGRIGVIAGGHLTTEDAYAISRLARTTLGTPHIDSRVQDAGAPYELALRLSPAAGSTATLNDVEAADTIVWAGPDPKEALPVLYLRLRQAVVDNRAKLIVVSPRRISLDAFATHVVRCEPGTEAAALESLGTKSSRPADAARDISEQCVVCWGPSSPGRSESAVAEAAVELAADRSAGFLMCPPHAGSQGLIDMGVHPKLSFGYEPAPAEGKDTRAMLEAAAAGELDALVVFGADLVADFPDAALARRALESVPFSVVVELLPTETVSLADVVLPSVAYAERPGTFTNLERRLQKLEPLIPPPGAAREPWMMCGNLALLLGDDWGWGVFDDVWADLRRDVHTHSGIDPVALAQHVPPTSLFYESGLEPHSSTQTVAGPGGQYPKGHRSGSAFQTGQNWPLSWELRAFEAKQRPGLIPAVSPNGAAAPEVATVVADQTRADDEFALYTGRQIYDEGTMVSRSAVLRALARRPFIELSPEDAGRLGLGDGDEALVTAGAFEARLRVSIADITPGAVFVPYDQQGLRANELLGAEHPTVRLSKATETSRA